MFCSSDVLNCCGLVAGQEFEDRTYTFKEGYKDRTDKEIESDFNRLIDFQMDEDAACAMIVLSSEQKRHLAQAQLQGFKIIQSFHNPKSFNECYILTRVTS